MEVRTFTDEWFVEDANVDAARHRGAELATAQPSQTAASLLRMLAAALDAAAVVQAGADSGVSGLYLLEGMAEDGVLTSIEAAPDADRASREAFRAAQADARVRSIAGDPLDVISRLTDHAYDLVVVGEVTSDPAPFLAQARRLLRPGGAAVFLRAFGPDETVLDPTLRDDVTMARRHFLNEISEDPTLIASLLPVDGGTLIVQLPKA